MQTIEIEYILFRERAANPPNPPTRSGLNDRRWESATRPSFGGKIRDPEM